MAVTSRDDAADEARWVRYGSAPLIATLLLPIIIGVIIVFKCVFNHCCVRKTTTKDEMYGLEGRMTMLPTAESDFVTLPRNSSSGAAAAGSSTSSTTEATGGSRSARSPPIGIAKRNSTEGETSEVKLRHHHFPLTAQVSGSGEKAGSNNNDHKAVESSPGSSVFNGDSRLRGSSGGASRLTSSQDSTELAGSLKRASAQHRQLPDLPQTPGTGTTSHPPRRSSSVLSHDGTSELYATVGETPLPEGSSSKRSSHYAQIRENPIANSSGKLGSSSSGSLLPVTNGIPPGPSSGGSAIPRLKGSEATPSSDSETYASTSLNHPYAKLKKNSAEHPYARVRAANNNNDEETDTDNYDLPQFLTRQVVGAPGGGPSTSGHHAPLQNRGSSSGVPAASAAGGGASSGVADDDDDEEGPVPPRRIGRPWRRNSQPNNADNASHFSGDSHDSRGYTSISVREPLSNLRNQTVASTRHYDSHYATVSDDSEEMYAAIDDPNDSNYMRIPGDHDNNNPRRPTWLGGPNVASPIPERREANSPLPPVPLVPPPDLSPGAQGPTTNAPGSPNANALPPLPSSALALPPQTSALPVYAQVTKKKKGQGNKAAVTQTASNASTSSSQQILVREAPLGSENPLPPPPLAKDSMSSSSSHSHYATSSHHQHHRSKRAASLMDNSNPMDADTVDSRRWSKADISYSEFEVVRENLFPTSSETNALIDDPPLQHHLLRSPGSGRSDVSPTSTSSAVRQQQQQQELVDEDNYNIIPEKNPGRSSRQSGVVVSSATSSSTAPLSSVALGPPTGTRIRLDSGNYHEIEPRNLNNTYQEIGGGKEPSDHYQEIGDRCKDDEYDDDDGGELYQVIDKKSNKNNSEFEDDDEEEDQFYERVKKPGSREGKKHGYEKIKKKEPSSSSSKPHPPGNLSRVKPALGSDEDEDDEGDDKADQMYESVKYPPYERLKESKDDLLDSEDARNNGSDYYEDIGYSRVKPKGSSSSKAKTPEASTAADTRLTCFVAGADNHQLKPPPDISHLYAQVDKTKKRGSKSSSTVQVTSPDNSVVQDISGNNNEPIMCMPLYSKVNKVSKNKGSGSSTANRNTATVVAAGSAGEQGHLHHSHHQPGNHSSSRSSTNDNSIEYI